MDAPPPRSPHPAPIASRRPVLPGLTGLRALAAVGVVAFHYCAPRLASDGGAVARVVRAGYVGVSFFFVLSGFILAYTYLDDEGRMRGPAREFWWARVARVYPVYLLALLVAAPNVLLGLRHAPIDGVASAGTRVAALLAPALLQGWWPPATCAWNCAGWSLSVEAFFYALFPAIALGLARVPRRGAVFVGVVAWATALLAPAAYLALAPDGIAHTTYASAGFWLDALRYAPPVHLGEFILGVACGRTFATARFEGTPPAIVRSVGAAALAAVVAVLALDGRVPYPLVHSGLLAPAFAALVIAAAYRRGWSARCFANPALVALGEASFALYLLHEPIRAIMQTVAHALGVGALSPIMDVGVVAVAVVSSLAVFRWVEEPARRWLRDRGPSRKVAPARDAMPGTPALGLAVERATAA